MVTAFAPYKRIDVAVAAFRKLDRRLWVVGSGQEEERLKPLFGGSIEWLGAVTDARVAELYQGCRAFVMPGPEDFGLTPLEAQASGRPVIALGHGGALETVVPLQPGAPAIGPGPTGILYAPREDEVGALVDAVRLFEENEARFEQAACRANAERFSPARFREGMVRAIRELMTMS
jgi:glycosyltransferase involved in cell wall biosynthesis